MASVLTVLILLVQFLSLSLATDNTTSCASSLKDPGVKHFEIKLPEGLQVPAVQTYYVCQQYKIPDELLSEDYHIVAFNPLVDRNGVMHHQLLFGCKDGTQASDPHRCGGLEHTCRSFLTVWSLGFSSDTCLYPHTGISIGKNGYKTLSLQIHWNNEHASANKSDSSGIRIYYTPALRKYELGNVQIGQDDIEIPAGAVRKEVAGGCRNYCTSKLFTKPFYLTRTFIHMHSLGVAGRMDHYRDGRLVANIAYDQTYTYKKPPVHDHPRAIKIMPGDEIKLSCWFTSSGGDRERNRTIYWGEGVEGEMCYAFVSYFPKADGFDQCVQYADYDQCDNYINQTMIMGDCDFSRFLMEMGGDIGTVRLHCDEETTTKCDSDCAKSVQRIYNHPCMQGRLAVFLQQRAARTVNWDKISNIHKKLKACHDNIMK